MSRATIAAGAADNTPAESARMDQRPRHIQARSADARHAAHRSADRRACGISIHVALKDNDDGRPDTSDSRLSDGNASRDAALLEWLHSWVVTVDHKKLGILYIVYAIFFLLVAGAEAMAMRIQLAIPNNHFLSPATLQRALHHARHHDGFPGRDDHSLRLRQLSGSADDRRARHGLSAAECIQLLDDGLRRAAALLQLYRRLWPVRHGHCARRGLVAYAPLTARRFRRA